MSIILVHSLSDLKEKINMVSIGSNHFELLTMLFQIFYLALLGVGVYIIVLIIKLALRGIKALDIYIKEKTQI